MFWNFIMPWWNFQQLIWDCGHPNFLENKMKVSFCWNPINIFRYCLNLSVTLLKINASYSVKIFLFRDFRLVKFCFTFSYLLILENLHYLTIFIYRNCKLDFSLLSFSLTKLILVIFNGWAHFINLLQMFVNLFCR